MNNDRAGRVVCQIGLALTEWDCKWDLDGIGAAPGIPFPGTVHIHLSDCNQLSGDMCQGEMECSDALSARWSWPTTYKVSFACRRRFVYLSRYIGAPFLYFLEATGKHKFALSDSISDSKSSRAQDP